ncbi:MAG: GNAT family N-acetyltransferase [Alphaproteobacteria bacterium]|nr:GNAT family N-acetyltransferase [Alphaproteobacteria bacterium]
MAEIPKTRMSVSADEAARLRAFTRNAEWMNGRIAGARVAQPKDAEALAGLLSDPSIGPKIYTVPSVINAATMSAFIEDHLMQRARGEGILFVSFNTDGAATAYFDVELWPEWGAVKFGGAVRASRQGRGFGGACGLAAVEWCFDQLGVARICETTALDNDRSIRLLSRLGFEQLGQVTAYRPDGTPRASLYWELERSRWTEGRAVRRAG